MPIWRADWRDEGFFGLGDMAGTVGISHGSIDGIRCTAKAVRVSALRCFAVASALAFAGSADAGALKSPMPAGAESGVTRVAVFGKDQRVKVPNALGRLRQSVGLLFNNQARTVCSAFCVSPRVIATAAHCLSEDGARLRGDLASFQFSLKAAGKQRSARLAGASDNTIRHHVILGSTPGASHGKVDASEDWALARLEAPLCGQRALPFERRDRASLLKLSKSKRVFQVSFHRDFADWQLAYSNPCPLSKRAGAISRKDLAGEFRSPDQLMLHTCDTGVASSGSPLLMLIDGKPRFVAINVGTYVQTRLMMRDGKVVHRFRADPIANTAVIAGAFVDVIERLEEDDILRAPRAMRRLQSRLKAIGAYVGPVDGMYGPQTRRAVKLGEAAIGWSETGLPTRALLGAL
ncbi:MAG: peptidoglycan-binding protein, partial [Pseudomonadota bacterium]